MRKALSSIGREAFSWARQGHLMFLAPKRETPIASDAERVIVFVHGFGATGPIFEPMRLEVERRLSLPTAHFTYSSASTFEEITRSLGAYLDRLAHGRRLDLVGHSLGGLLSRWYVQEMDGARHVERIVTLATPHAGTASARMAIGPLRRVLLPGSLVLRRLSVGRERASRIAHTAFVAGADLMVTPPESAAAIDDASVRWFDELGHNGLLYDRGVHDALIDALADAPTLERTG